MIKYALLGVAQGLTEFLPVSSSGHLVVMQQLLGMRGEEVAVSLILHLGTILSLLVFFFKDILAALRQRRTLLLILLVTLVTGAVGLAGKDFFESLFSSARYVAAAWLVTGAVMILTRRAMEGKRTVLTAKDALVLGLSQAAAIIPSLSRSGLTIASLLFRKIDKEAAFKFSFLAGMPAIMGAAILEAKEIDLALRLNPLNLAAGFIFSFLSGLLALCLLRQAINKARLHYFGYYCIVVAIAAFLFVR